MDNLAKRIEAILFINGEAISIDRLVKLLGGDKTKIRQAAEQLDQALANTALTLVFKDDFLQLVTRPAFAKDIEVIISEEVSREISKAAAETLAVIAYKGPLTRTEVDYIRGVNSSYTLRNLLIRSLIERKVSQKDTRTFIYSVSVDFLKFLGISRIEELPEYAGFTEKIEKFLSADSKEN